jgi:hypothetical protein
MSQENVEAAERFIDAYNRRDVEAMLGGEAAVFRGHEGFRRR